MLLTLILQLENKRLHYYGWQTMEKELKEQVDKGRNRCMKKAVKTPVNPVLHGGIMG